MARYTDWTGVRSSEMLDIRTDLANLGIPEEEWASYLFDFDIAVMEWWNGSRHSGRNNSSGGSRTARS